MMERAIVLVWMLSKDICLKGESYPRGERDGRDIGLSRMS